MTDQNAKPECFVLMPISDPDGYANGHFNRVFMDIFAPACETAGYRAVRADQIKQTNLIHLDVLQRLLQSPMALCDLSSRNPNVLFELGLRQAFDKPVVLVREVGTPDVFDIAPLRYVEYRRDRIYNEVLEDQRALAAAMSTTAEACKNNEGVNSIVRLLGLIKKAEIVDVERVSADPLLNIVRSEISALRDEIRGAIQKPQPGVRTFHSDNLPVDPVEQLARTRASAVDIAKTRTKDRVAVSPDRLQRAFRDFTGALTSEALNRLPVVDREMVRAEHDFVSRVVFSDLFGYPMPTVNDADWTRTPTAT